MKIAVLPGLEDRTYVSHELHGAQRAWGETNCYIDVWIEVLNSLRLEPAACLSTVFAIDFDGDQWTFFKPPHEDLFSLYGLDVQELNVWSSLSEQASMQLRLGRLVLAEMDAYFLPDTQGTDYRTQHTKTTICMQEIDLEQRALGYFHNRAYHRLEGEDFVQLFRVGFDTDKTYMPFFAEFVRLDRLERRPAAELAEIARELLDKHLARRPSANPVAAFRASFMAAVEQLKGDGLARYHAYAFATLRQLGAAFELGAYHLQWLERHGQGDFAAAAGSFTALSDTTKVLLLKAARAVAGKKPVDLGPMLDEMAAHWAKGMDELDSARH
jgi:hypothetical protein